MRRKTLALLGIVLAMFLTACGNAVTPAEAPSQTTPAFRADPPALPAPQDDFSRGVWEDNIYTNESLGLRFTMPTRWIVLTDEEIADVMGFSGVANRTLLLDMMAASLTGSNVSVMFVRLTPRFEGMTEAEYIEARGHGTAGTRIDQGDHGTTRIGRYDWYSTVTRMDSQGVIAYGHQFINLHDGFARHITITIFEDSETLEEILAIFDSLED